MSIADFPRYPLLFGPSPVHPLDRLSNYLGGPRIWAKREDCNSGLAYGGNKTRKLEYLVPDALAQGGKRSDNGRVWLGNPFASRGLTNTRGADSGGRSRFRWGVSGGKTGDTRI